MWSILHLTLNEQLSCSLLLNSSLILSRGQTLGLPKPSPI